MCQSDCAGVFIHAYLCACKNVCVGVCVFGLRAPD